MPRKKGITPAGMVWVDGGRISPQVFRGGRLPAPEDLGEIRPPSTHTIPAGVDPVRGSARTTSTVVPCGNWLILNVVPVVPSTSSNPAFAMRYCLRAPRNPRVGVGVVPIDTQEPGFGPPYSLR